MWGRRATRLSMLLVCAFAASAPAHAQDRYSLAGGCWSVDGGEPLRFQATDLGHYLLYTKDGKYLTRPADGSTTREADPSADAVWTGGEDMTRNGKALRLASADGCAVSPEVGANV